MSDPKETQEGLFVMKWRNFLPLIISMILGTNAASIFYQTQNNNINQIEYNKKRSDRIAERNIEELKQHILITNLKIELNNCKEK